MAMVVGKNYSSLAVVLLVQVMTRGTIVNAFLPTSSQTCTRPIDCSSADASTFRLHEQPQPGTNTVVTPIIEEDNGVSAEMERYDTATQLLDLLLEKRNEDIESPFEAFMRRRKPSNEQLQKERMDSIEDLIETLTLPILGEGQRKQATGGFFDRLKPQPKLPKYYYDPTESLFGSGFYCTLYFYYPNTDSDSSSPGTTPEDPIWEKTSLKASNIKGQQYYVRNDFQQSVINYSEVWGSAVTIMAEGILTPIDGANDEKSSRPLANAKKDSRSLRKLPDVFRVDATKISASVFGLSLNFNIQGSANLVVLYADPRIRIFVSPLPSETVVGNWEEAGLVVVQVRGDLVPAANRQIPRLIDLR